MLLLERLALTNICQESGLVQAIENKTQDFITNTFLLIITVIFFLSFLLVCIGKKVKLSITIHHVVQKTVDTIPQYTATATMLCHPLRILNWRKNEAKKAYSYERKVLGYILLSNWLMIAFSFTSPNTR